MFRKQLLVSFFFLLAATACESTVIEATPTSTAVPTAAPTKTPVPTPTISPEEQALSIYEAAFAYQAAEEWDQAIAAYTEVLALVPEHAAALINRGICHYMLRDVDASTADIEAALALDYTPDSAQMFVNRGRAQSMINNLGTAIEDFDRAIEMDPNLTEAYVRRANIQVQLGELELAFADLEYAIELDPDYELIYLKLGYAHEEEGDYEAAVEAYTKAIELDSDDAMSYYFRGLALANLGEFARGVEDMQQAVNLDPEMAYAEFYMGLMYSDLNEPDLSVEHLTLAIELGLDPEDEEYAASTIETLQNPVEEVLPNAAWLIGLDDLPQITVDWGIGYWEYWDELSGEYIACVMHGGQSWSVSANVSENCIFSVDPGMDMDELMEAVRDAEFLSRTAVAVEPRSSFDAEYRVFADMLDNGHADFRMYLLENNLLYMATISLGQGVGSTPEGLYESGGKEIDQLLYNIIQINLNRRYAGEASEVDDGSVLFGGTTSQGKFFKLKVEGDLVTEIVIDYDIAGCEDYTRTQMLVELPINEGAFLLDNKTTMIAGEFTESGGVEGAFLIRSHFFCSEELSGTWQASAGYDEPDVQIPADMFPTMAVPEDLFSPELGEENFYQPGLDSYGDWVFYQSAMQSMLPVPKGWWTYETGEETFIEFARDPENDLADISIRLSYQPGQENAALIEEFDNYLSDNHGAILSRQNISEDLSYITFEVTLDSGEVKWVLVVFSRDREHSRGDLSFVFSASMPAAERDAFYPLVRAMLSHWVAYDFDRLGLDLPETLP